MVRDRNPRIAPRLATEDDPRHRCGLARELVRAGDCSQVAVMAEILAGDDSRGHVHAAESLFKVGEVGLAAVSRNLDSADDAIRTAAANMAGEARAAATAATLVRLLDDPVLDTRIRAAHSLLVLDRP